MKDTLHPLEAILFQAQIEAMQSVQNGSIRFEIKVQNGLPMSLITVSNTAGIEMESVKHLSKKQLNETR